MNTTEQVISGNKLIAEFMEWKHSWQKITPEFNLHYHTSWDWLKPVIDEIFTYALAHPEQVEPIRKMSIVVEIGVAWERVVNFIQWYNQNKQQ